MKDWIVRLITFIRNQRWDSIRSRLLVFGLLATLIPSLSTGWLSYTENRRSLEAKVAQELASESSQSARELGLWFKERLTDLRVFARSETIAEKLERLAGLGSGQPRSTVATEIARYLSSVKGKFPDYEELMVLDSQGRVIGTTATRSGPLQLPRDWLEDLRGDKEVLGNPYWDSTYGKAAVVIAVPVHAGAFQVVGAVAARANLHGIDRMLREFIPGDSGRTYVVTTDGGALIAGSATPTRDLMRQRVAPGILKALLENQGKPSQYRSYTRQSVVGTLQSVSRPNWSVVVEVPDDAAFRQIIRLRNLTVLLVLAQLMAVGLLAYLFGLQIVKPLNRLTEGATNVAGGDLGVDLPVQDEGEIGLLTKAFNGMVHRLREGREKLEQLSITDGLTGLANRRHLMERLTTEVSRARRARQTFAVLMVDVDHFKKYNDTHGHQAGDEVLARLGAIFREATRDVDCAARYGGEEFLVLLTETGLDGAVDAAERLRTRLLAEDFMGGKITLSIGVAEFPEHGETPEAVIQSADSALYRAKHEGRDRVVRPALRRRSREMKGPA